ncbi:hypothetical protein TWF730_007921 [Orbilia blumenaviensis]|uniref:Uncharacterized protein n=1 Tax=Orbilia blumenaviensis TaxID=1796055 RepID=A0AAV9VCI3_9PEZI
MAAAVTHFHGGLSHRVYECGYTLATGSLSSIINIYLIIALRAKSKIHYQWVIFTLSIALCMVWFAEIIMLSAVFKPYDDAFILLCLGIVIWSLYITFTIVYGKSVLRDLLSPSTSSPAPIESGLITDEMKNTAQPSYIRVQPTHSSTGDLEIGLAQRGAELGPPGNYVNPQFSRHEVDGLDTTVLSMRAEMPASQPQPLAEMPAAGQNSRGRNW